MSGTQAGAKLAAETIKRKYGEEFYQKIGVMGGRAKSPTKGFGFSREHASACGRKGGAVSSRRGIMNKPKVNFLRRLLNGNG